MVAVVFSTVARTSKVVGLLGAVSKTEPIPFASVELVERSSTASSGSPPLDGNAKLTW
jgi:hypothetical protein